MKIYVVVAVLFSAVVFAEEDPKCAGGPSYWCSSVTAAKSCGAWNHCKTTVWKNQILKQDGKDECLFCTAFIGDVKKFIEAGKTKEEVTKFLDSACGIIPDKSLSDQCKHSVEYMITEVLELIDSGVDPLAVCSLMGVCSGPEDEVNQSPAINKPAETNVEVSPVNQEPICGDCKKFFGDIRDMITSNKTEADVESLIDQNVCSLLGPLRDQCKALVHEFLPELMQYLSSYYDPNVICQGLGVCNADKKFYAPNFELFVRLSEVPPYKIPKGETSIGQCLMCKAILSQLQMIIRNKSFQHALIDFAKNNFCSHTGTIRDICDKTVDEYSTQLFQLLVNLLEPTVRCKAIGLCTASNDGSNAGPVKTMSMIALTPAKYSPDVTGKKLESGPQCVLCQLVMKEIVSLIGTNKTEALEKVCHMIPSQLTAGCVDFVDTYGPAVIKLIIQELDPTLVCTALHLCDKTQGPADSIPAIPAVSVAQPIKAVPLVSATLHYISDKTQGPADSIPAVPAIPAVSVAQPIKAVPHVPATRPGVDAGSNELCSVCEMMIQYLEKMLQDNSTVAEIEAMLSRICYHLPAKYIDKCNNIVKQYTDLIIYYIQAFVSPKEICTLIGVCDKTSDLSEIRQSVPVNGQNECSWGSTYWCATRDNAEKCNAVNYCKRFIWKAGQQ